MLQSGKWKEEVYYGQTIFIPRSLWDTCTRIRSSVHMYSKFCDKNKIKYTCGARLICKPDNSHTDNRKFAVFQMCLYSLYFLWMRGNYTFCQFILWPAPYIYFPICSYFLFFFQDIFITLYSYTLKKMGNVPLGV